MSESLKKVAGVVGLVALGFVTFGVGSLIVGGASVASAVGGGIAFGSALSISFGTLATIGFAGLSIATAPNIPIDDTGAGDRGLPHVDPNAAAIYVFGTTLVPSVLVYEESYYTTNGSNYPYKLLVDVFAHAWHEIESYQTFIVGTQDGPVEVEFVLEVPTISSPIGDRIRWITADGSQTQSLYDSHVSTALVGSNWPSSAVGAGIAHSAIIHLYQEEDYQQWFGGTPRQIEIEVQGAKLYDPRLDPTYGSGSQDYADPATWTFNNGNAALVLLRALIGEYSSGGRLIWGRGASESEIDMSTFVAMANIADETVDSKPRFRLGGMHNWAASWAAFVRQWEQETGGKLSKSGGVYKVWLPHDDLTPITTLTDDKFINGIALEHTLGQLEGLYNTARGRYIEPTEGYKPLPYPDIEEATAITADGESRVLEQEFSWVQDVSIAERIARIKVRRSRYQRIWVVGLGWEGRGPNYDIFTVHNINTKETDNINVLVRVIDRKRHLDGTTILILQEENAAIYDDTIPLGTPNTTSAPPNYNPPGVVPLGFTNNFSYIPQFAPGVMGGSSNFNFFPNKTGGGASADGLIRITGTVFRHPDGTDRYVDDADDAVSTPFGAGSAGKFFLMWSDTDPEARFTTLGTFTHSNILAVIHNGTSWQAIDTAGAIETFTPVSTDCLIAVGEGASTSGGITRFITFIDGNLPQYTNSILNGNFEGGFVGWIPSAASITIIEDAANSYFGTWAGRFNSAADGATLTNTAKVPVRESERVLASGYCKLSGGALRVQIVWLDDTGTPISTSDGDSLTGATYAQSRVIATAPATAVEAEFRFICTGTTSGYVDGAIMTITVRDSDIDALNTINGPSEANADVTGNAIPNILGGSLLPNWYFGITDSVGKPAGLRGVESISDRTQIQFGGIGIQILSSPDTTVAYGFSAIPIDDRKQYQVTIRHRSSAASVDGLYLRFNELDTTLPSGKTHVGHNDGESETQLRVSYVGLVENGPMPGTTTIEETYTYTPTPGTILASLGLYNYAPATPGVIYEVEFVQLRELPTKTSHFAGNVPVDEFYDIMNYNGGVLLDDGVVLEKRWSRASGGVPTSEITVQATTDAPGGTFMRFGNNAGDDMWWGYFDDFLIPYDGVSLYEVGVIARKTAGTGMFYCGLEGVTSDGVTMVNISGADSHSSQHYLAASGIDLGSSWQILRGFVQGYSGAPDTANKNDSLNPGQMFNGTVYIRPMALVNYNSTAGITDIAAVWVKRVPGATGALDVITADAISVGNLSAISADLGSITAGSIVLPTGGFIRSGQTAFDTGTGFYLGNDAGTPKISVGNSTAEKWSWNGSVMELVGRMELTNTAQSFAPTWTGFSANPSGNISYVDFGAFVVMYITSALTGTSNVNSMQITNVPAIIRPSGSRLVACTALHANRFGSFITVPAHATITSGGVITFSVFKPQVSQDPRFYEGFVDASAAAEIVPAGWSATNPGTGLYTITHNLGLANPNSLAIACAPTGTTVTWGVTARAANSFSVRMNGSSFTAVNMDFTFFCSSGEEFWTDITALNSTPSGFHTSTTGKGLPAGWILVYPK